MIVPGRFLFLFSLLLCTAAAAPAASRRVLVDLRSPLTADARADLARDGLTIGRRIAGGRYLGKIRPGADLERDSRIVSIEPLGTQHKIHLSATREAARPQAFARLNVFFHDDVTLDEARAATDAAGGTYEALQTDFLHSHRLKVQVPGSRLASLAEDDRVLMITGAASRRASARNVNSASLSRVNLVHAVPYNLSGQGVVLSLFELGEAKYTHGDFGGRLTTHVSEGANDLHASHVAGTMGGSGAGNANAKGMAIASTMHQYRVDESDNDNNIVMKDLNLAPLGVVADNNSWGWVLGWDGAVWMDLEDSMGAYSLDYSAPLDRIAKAKNILFVHSAGNDAIPPGLDSDGRHFHWNTEGESWCYSKNGLGNDCPSPCSQVPGRCETTRHLANAPWTTIGDQESAKNIVLVGAVNSDKSLASYSSRGPARDGRIKPELVAKGNFVTSTAPAGYATLSGTSMAAPVVTGIAGLLAQQWRATFGGVSPTAAQLKTVLIAGAEDLGNAGPDYSFGFGLVDAKASVDLVVADAAAGRRIRSASLAQGQSYEALVTLTSPQDLRVVLGWSDPDALFLGNSNVADPALVNDLDLRVIDSSNSVTYPYVLNRNSPAAAAARAANHVDNTEMVEIPNAPAGTYRVVVDATSISDESPQQFALVANAPVANTTVSNVVLTATGTTVPSVSLTWTSAGAGATYDVYQRSGTGAYVLRTVGLTGTSYVDVDIAGNAAFLYKLLVHVPGSPDTWTNADLAATLALDPTMAAGNVVKFAHVDELTTVTNLVRALAGLGPISWTSTPVLGGAVRASHVTDLRTGISTARTALGLPAATFTRTLTPGSTTILATDFTEIRTALR